MKNYKYIGILVLAWLFTLPAVAQLGEERHNFAVGINGGLNMNSVSFDPKIKQNTLNGMEMGVTLRYMSEKYFKMMCGVQMEINYSQRGWSEKIEDGSENTYSRTMNYVEIPLFAHFGMSTGIGHFLLEGRYYMGLGDFYKSTKKDYFGRSAHSYIGVRAAYLFDITK